MADRVKTMSYTEFLNWAGDEVRAEWVAGKVYLMSPASLRHQLLVLFLSTLLNVYVTRKQMGQIIAAPFQMKLAVPNRGREPDILFVAAEHLSRLSDQYLDGPADMVVEVISPESIERDRQIKYAEYETAGIPEYWVIDPQQEEANFYQLDLNQRYYPAPITQDSRYHSKIIPGFWLYTDWLWQEPLPDVVTALREMQVL